MSQTVEIWLIGTRRKGNRVGLGIQRRAVLQRAVRIRETSEIPAVLRRVVIDVDKLLAVASRDQVAA